MSEEGVSITCGAQGCSSPTAMNPSLIDAGVSNAISQYMEHGDDCGPWGQPCSLLTKQEELHNRLLVKDLTKIRPQHHQRDELTYVLFQNALFLTLSQMQMREQPVCFVHNVRAHCCFE